MSFAVSCRHCTKPLCVKSCITGALSISDGVITINRDKCIAATPAYLYALRRGLPPRTGRKNASCIKNSFGSPACVGGCPNGAIVFEERG